jgi:hypothetical protein
VAQDPHDRPRVDFKIHQQRCAGPPRVVNRHLADTGLVTSSGRRRLRVRGSRTSHTYRRTPGVDPRQPRQTSPTFALPLSWSARRSSGAVPTRSAAIRLLGRARVFRKAYAASLAQAIALAGQKCLGPPAGQGPRAGPWRGDQNASSRAFSKLRRDQPWLERRADGVHHTPCHRAGVSQRYRSGASQRVGAPREPARRAPAPC